MTIFISAIIELSKRYLVYDPETYTSQQKKPGNL